MSRKPTKKSLKRRLDKEVSRIVRARGKCQRCYSTKNLQAAHCHSRTYLNTRWDIENNVFCLCASCHFYLHKNPLMWTEFLKSEIGEDRIELLREARNLVYKPTISDLEIKLKVLKEITIHLIH